MIDHPTTDVSEQNENLQKIEGLVYDHGDRYELLALEYDDNPVPGSTALALYNSDLDILYEDVHGNSAFDTGETTWDEVTRLMQK
jgi:hypothetical protein